MIKETATYNYRVQEWTIPTGSPWLPQKWTLRSSVLRKEAPSVGRGIPSHTKTTRSKNRTVYEWARNDSYKTPVRMVVTKLKKPQTITEEVSYI